MSFDGAARSLVRQLARAHVPQLDGLVPAPADHALAVETDRHTVYEISMSLEGEQIVPRGSVPHLHRTVIAAADDAFAVGTERHALYVLRVALEGEQILTCVSVPHLHRPVIV